MLAQRPRTWCANVTIALIEANRVIYTQKEKVIPIMVNATKKPQEAVIFPMTTWTKNCVWSVNTGFSKDRTEWSIENAIENGDIPAEKNLATSSVVDIKLGDEALKGVPAGRRRSRLCGLRIVTRVVVRVRESTNHEHEHERARRGTNGRLTHSLRSKISLDDWRVFNNMVDSPYYRDAVYEKFSDG